MDERTAVRDFRERGMALLKWFKDAAIITSGGWAALAVAVWAAPIGKLVGEAPGITGAGLGITFLLGCAITATAWWVVTGRNPTDRLLGIKCWGLR